MRIELLAVPLLEERVGYVAGGADCGWGARGY